MKALKLWLKASLISIAIVLLVKVFVMDIFTVATSSMEASVKPGDIVLVDKISIGSRFPSTILALPFLHQYIPFTNQTPCFLPYLALPYWRMPAIHSLKINDVVLINYPYEASFPRDHKTLFLKRIVALPGDPFELKSGHILINSKTEEESNQLKKQYFIQFEMPVENRFFTENEIEINGQHSETKYTLNVTEKEIEEILPSIFYKEQIIDSVYDPHQMIFPNSKIIKNTKDNFLPFIIPKKGKSISINSNNIDYYLDILEKFEKVEVEKTDREIFIDGILASQYTFKLNYFFVMGDNRSHSADSRYWGLLPEDHIAGKAQLVLFSIRPKFTGATGVRWSRILKTL